MLAAELGCDALVNYSAGDFLYPTHAHVLAGMVQGREWQAAARLVGNALSTWRQGRRPWRNHILRGYLRSVLGSPTAAKPSGYRWQFLSSAARDALAELPSPFSEADTHPVPAYVRFMLTTLAFHRNHESYFAERRGLAYLDPYQNERLALFMLTLPFSFSYREGQNKWIMRQMAQGLIPESIRLTAPSGNLLGFLKYGYHRHRHEVRTLILAGRPHWNRSLEESAVDELLDQARPSEGALVLIIQLIGYCLWCQRWK